MATHEARLLRREAVAEGTLAFHFSKPEGLQHAAGQALLMVLRDPPETDGEGNSRVFSIASAPHEAELMFATRMRDTAFKRVLGAAPPGTAVRLAGPTGRMVLHEDAARPAVLLAGGIGVTPFLAMARDAAHRRLAHSLLLFYANRRPEDAAFLAELQQLAHTNPHFSLIATMSDAPRSAQRWAGETGRIRPELLARHLPAGASPVYYIAGPPAMADAMQQMLAGMGVAEEAVRCEAFRGY